SQYSLVHRAGVDADCRFLAGRIHGRVPVSRDTARPRGIDRRALRTAHARDYHRVRAASGRLRRSSRELPRLPRLLAPGRAGPAVDAVGRDLPALRVAADDPAAFGLRSVAVLDSLVPRR